MSNNNDNAAAAVVAFISGAVLGGVAALLLTPKSGREVREKLCGFQEEAAGRLKKYAREAKYRVSPKNKGENTSYDGGDCWI